MPTYSYACRECVHRFDIQQAFSDPSLTACPECGSALRKLYGSVGVVFKGSGFYRNDSRSAAAADKTSSGSTTESSPAPAKATKDTSSSAGSSGESKTPSSTGSAAKAAQS